MEPNPIYQYILKIIYRPQTIVTILQNIYQCNAPQVNIKIDIDLVHAANFSTQVANFIVGNLFQFQKLLNLLVYKSAVKESERQNNPFLKEKLLNISDKDMNCNINFISCPINRKNIQSIDFLRQYTQMYLQQKQQKQQGILVYLKDILVIQVYKLEVYLFAWTQIWSNCLCQNRILRQRNSQSLMQAAKIGALRERVIKTKRICDICDHQFRQSQIQDQIFLNCKKIKFFCDMKSGIIGQQIFQTGILEIYLNSQQINLVKVGETFDICCFWCFQVNPKSNIYLGSRMKPQFQLLGVCINAFPAKHPHNNRFLSDLKSIKINYWKGTGKNYQKLYLNYCQILKALNQIKFPYCPKRSYTLLKLAILSSVFLRYRQLNQYQQQKYVNRCLNLLILSDQQQLISEILRLPHLTLKKWPLIYDSQSITNFVFSCHQCILLIVNPSKKDMIYLNDLLQRKWNYEGHLLALDITIWILLNPSNKSKDFAIDKFDIVVDVSFVQNRQDRQIDHDISFLIDNKLASFIPEYQQIYIDHFYQTLCHAQSEPENDICPLLERYYVRSREFKKTTLNDFISLQKTAQAICQFRSYFSGSTKQIALIDAILAIFLQQQTSRNKRGNGHTLFANEISKFLLNQNDSMTILQYEYSQTMQQIRRNVSKQEVFIKIVNQINNLLYNKDD